MKIQPNSKLLLIGDSITDCGRGRPIAESSLNALGDGHVSLLNPFFTTTVSQARLRIVNMGTSGNTVRDLAARWDSDVVALNPDWLTICIGINDVWRQFDARLQVESFVTLDEYMRTLEDLIRTTRPQICGWSL